MIKIWGATRQRICGQTLYGGVPDKRYSYFFGRSGSSWGWATWKRVADTWESDYQYLNDDYYLDLAAHRYGRVKTFKKSIEGSKQKKDSGIAYWEEITGYRTLLNTGLVIYPTVNMVENVGTSKNATHAVENLKELPKKIQKMFITRAEDVEFPLKHPPYVIEDYRYFDKIYKVAHPMFFSKIARKLERLLRKICR